MPIGRRPVPREWLFGALVGLLGAGLRALVQPLIGDHLPFLLAVPATVLASLLWGTGSGLLAALICAAAVALPALPPNVLPIDRPIQVGGFLVTAVLIALLCARLGKARVPAEEHRAAGVPAETPLTAWLRAVLWGAFLIPTTAFVTTAWWGFERTRSEAEAAVAHACDLAYRQAQRTFAIAADIAARADTISSGDADAVRARGAEIHQRLADLAAGVPSIVNLNVWDADGRPIARSDLYPVDPNASVADRKYFQEQRDARKPLGVSEVLTGRQTGLELTNATIRRTSPDGSFRGVVAVSLSPGFFRDYYESLASEEPKLATFALIRIDGEILARWPKTPDGRTHVPPESPILKRIRAGDAAGSLTLVASGRETRLASFRRVEGYPVYVVAGVSRAAMFASWARFVALLAAIMVPTTIGLVYVSWVALRKTRREQATAAELREEIRRRASAEHSMLESQRLETLAVVTGGVAHDFNNLLAIVNASLHVLKRRHPELAPDKHIQAMSRAIQSGTRLTRQLLSFSRKQALRPETVLLQNWLPSTESLIVSTLGAEVSWQLQIDPDTRPVRVDLGELELALINLVVNARHAMPDGGSLRAHAANAVERSPAGASMVLICVEDSGIGIPPELLPKVLEPFFTTRSKGAGSGLGLSQVQGFCIQAGGHIHLESTVGKGTTVCMFLPAAEDAPEVAAGAEPGLARPLQGRVLLVEDNDEVASTTEAMLRTAGLDVVRVPSADAALAHLEGSEPSPDVVFSDISMPGSMNGIGLAFELRKRRPALPVLLTTGYAEQVSLAVAGGFRVLAKPTAPDELLGELGIIMSRSGGTVAAP
jgi:two-component system NtrC family sensor kinase